MAQASSFIQDQTSACKGFIDDYSDEQLRGVEVEVEDQSHFGSKPRQIQSQEPSEEKRSEKEPSKQSDKEDKDSWVVMSQEEQKQEPKNDPYDFMNQNDELEVVIQPLESQLKFSNLDAINQPNFADK